MSEPKKTVVLLSIVAISALLFTPLTWAVWLLLGFVFGVVVMS